MTHRIIRGLLWAHQAARAPHQPTKRRRGAKAIGLRYEKALAKALPSARHGLWFEFADANGRGFCQPDFLIELFGVPFVLETKLRDCCGGLAQIAELYQPVMSMVLGKRVCGIAIVRTLSALPPSITAHQGLREAANAALGGTPSVLLWREGYPLVLGPHKGAAGACALDTSSMPA